MFCLRDLISSLRARMSSERLARAWFARARSARTAARSSSRCLTSPWREAAWSKARCFVAATTSARAPSSSSRRETSSPTPNVLRSSAPRTLWWTDTAAGVTGSHESASSKADGAVSSRLRRSSGVSRAATASYGFATSSSSASLAKLTSTLASIRSAPASSSTNRGNSPSSSSSSFASSALLCGTTASPRGAGAGPSAVSAVARPSATASPGGGADDSLATVEAPTLARLAACWAGSRGYLTMSVTSSVFSEKETFSRRSGTSPTAPRRSSTVRSAAMT
mmetsp:Transcript_9120/g.27949  ORF Transcript_9120/g.27949 Transcript_9120/m.27949 type:complete len:280 (-) Transcript_9120:336-1175(-)